MTGKLCFILLFFTGVLLYSCKSGEEDKIAIGFSQSVGNDLWRMSMNHSMEVEAALHSDVDLTIYNAHQHAKQQILDIQKFIDNKVDVIIVSPFEGDSIVPVIEKATNLGIPVILIDRKANTSNYTTYLGADNKEVGQLAGKQIVSLSKGVATVVEINGDYTTSPGIERSEGFNDFVRAYPGIKVHTISSDNYGYPKPDFKRLLDTLKNIDYVYSFNDVIAYNAWKIVNKRKEHKNKIKFIGVDGLNGPYGGIQLVKDGILNSTILYPTGGSEAIRLALRIVNKEMVPKNNKLNTVLIDTLNADIMSNQLDKITIQQSSIEQQQNIIEKREQEYATQSNLVKILVCLFILAIILAIYSIYSKIAISRKKRELEITNRKIKYQRNEIKKYSQELRESNEARLGFFMGLSHEFKTPLTLILSSVESLANEYKDKGIAVNKEISLMYNNSRRLLRLINQLLDYRKAEEKKFELKASKTNILIFSNAIVKNFDKEVMKKKIDFSLETNNPELEVHIDRNLMDKVYFNLLSNAFKFTPENGKISITIKEDIAKNEVKLVFSDSGIGIPETELQEVFRPFFQGSNNYRNSSGIGLHLSKNFIDLHKGSIEVHSKHGTEFVISLQLGKEHLEARNVIDVPAFEHVNEMDYLDAEVFQLSEPSNAEDKYSILYIEDNPELLDLMNQKLSVEYTVYTSDGNNAIEKVIEIIPDIVICDLNLPGKNGFEICQIIKKDLRSSHIPVIILTATDNQEAYLRALESGADIFLTKPFSLKVLGQSIKGLLFNREKLRFYYSNNIANIVSNEEKNFGSPEQDFLRKLNGLIESNIDNSVYTVEELASDLSISRVQLYRKVKAILGISVSDHINNIRLDKAKDLIVNSNKNISEIAYAVGYSSPNYFSTIFKNKFGVSPKEFKS
ncbi:hybrid sensor histidine kinase/response regulator transcription factor [Flavobacterium algicola]|uniref:hybrid sensor histidine kinase/response regulator transcription factor n=1 Tax=Flavobacterium algicola TaxID=556529 RepID=UPI001EFEAB51|nr:substrate-binding domain-containing protein [Flavobacterium algicola]MCG9791367.1 substrate-binding domain-containing protein [Flavobacterium algicola]